MGRQWGGRGSVGTVVELDVTQGALVVRNWGLEGCGGRWVGQECGTSDQQRGSGRCCEREPKDAVTRIGG